jgi:GNAT superfamily N-acetyltransferase
MIRYAVNGPASQDELNALFDAAWDRTGETNFDELLERSFIHVEAYAEAQLVGFVRVVRCGTTRGFVLGPTVHPDFQKQGVGRGLLDAAAAAAKEDGVKSLHVEFPSRLRIFYGRADFMPTAAGVRQL